MDFMSSVSTACKLMSWSALPQMLGHFQTRSCAVAAAAAVVMQWSKPHPSAAARSSKQLQQQLGSVASSSGSCSASKPPIAGRRSSRHLLGSGCSPASPPAAAAADGLIAANTALPRGHIAQPVATASAPGLIAAEWGLADRQQQQQQQLSGLGIAVPGGELSTGHDSDCEEAEIDRQLAALAALRQANRRAPAAAAVTGSISAKSIAAAGLRTALLWQ